MKRALIFTLLAACAAPTLPVDGPQNPTLAPKGGVEAEGECWAGADGARFRVLCDNELTRARISALQRALAARGAFDGPVNGRMGPQTRTALRTYQATFGLDSDQPARATFEALGLLPAPEFEAARQREADAPE